MKKTDDYSWIDADINYGEADLNAVRNIGTNNNIREFINGIVTDGTERKNITEDDFIKYSKFVRSYLAITDGNNIRPLLNNDSGIRLIKNCTFGRGGSVKTGGLATILTFKSTDVSRSINVEKNKVTKLNEDSEQAAEFNTIINKIYSYNDETVKEIAEKTKLDPIVVQDIISNEKITYKEPTFEMIREMVIEKNKYYKKPKDSLEKLKKDVEKIPVLNAFNENDDSRKFFEEPFPKIPENIIDEIVDNSVSKIHDSLHERAEKIEKLIITDEELREFSGILNPKGNDETKVEALEAIANEYRLKALREAEPRKEQLYKNIQETAELKTDLIYVLEGKEPEGKESKNIIKEVIESNESVNDLKKLEKFKKWAKENLLGLSAIMITIAGLITTVLVSTRSVILRGGSAVKKAGESIYQFFKNLAKDLGPVLGPVLNAVGNLLLALLKYGSEGIVWLSKNLWAIMVIIIVYLGNKKR